MALIDFASDSKGVPLTNVMRKMTTCRQHESYVIKENSKVLL